MPYPTDRKYTKEHEWITADGTVGITHHAQDSLGDIVFVELPKVGTEITAGKAFGTVESVKAVSDLYAPASGTVTGVNEDLALSLIHISEPTRLGMISYAVFCLKKKKKQKHREQTDLYLKKKKRKRNINKKT